MRGSEDDVFLFRTSIALSGPIRCLFTEGRIFFILAKENMIFVIY